ncbi:unnamed protein product, partial [Ixodes hexagonus]
MTVEDFLDLLLFYLKSAFAEWNKGIYLQKRGICIGSCLAPILSDIFLAYYDRVLLDRLSAVNVRRVFRFVDDFLVFLNYDAPHFHSVVDSLLTIFKDALHPLKLTHEVPVDGVIRFLDIKLTLSENHTCWIYQPRATKPLLPFNSSHSKLVKRGIANLCFKNALRRSCRHVTRLSILEQSERLLSAGYPKDVLVSVAEVILKRLRAKASPCPEEARRTQKFAVVPYLHKTAHNLKKIASRIGTKVVFSAPDKLAKLSHLTNPFRKASVGCVKKHRSPFVACVEGVVYQIPLSCGKKYVGQTGRCLNDRLREHNLNVNNYRDGHLSVHCHDCGCKPLFDTCSVLARHKNKTVREIIEAEEIKRSGVGCVSVASIDLFDKEL